MSDKGREEEEKEKGGFKVTDRRKFTPEGELREGVLESDQFEEPPTKAEEGGRAAPAQPVQKPGSELGAAAHASPAIAGVESEKPAGDKGQTEVDFPSFVLSLATSAMVQMGEIPDPASGRRAFSLEGAKQMIEIISMLQKKTEGNLEPDEAQMLEGILYELRMKYVEKSR